jgi:hypothetical protein
MIAGTKFRRFRFKSYLIALHLVEYPRRSGFSFYKTLIFKCFILTGIGGARFCVTENEHDTIKIDEFVISVMPIWKWLLAV